MHGRNRAICGKLETLGNEALVDRRIGDGNTRTSDSFLSNAMKRLAAKDAWLPAYVDYIQNRAIREYAARRGGPIVMQVSEVVVGAAQRELRRKLAPLSGAG
jgi:hypothetical protein